MSQQLHYRDVCKIALWSVEHILNHSTANLDQISSSIKRSLMERVHGHAYVSMSRIFIGSGHLLLPIEL